MAEAHEDAPGHELQVRRPSVEGGERVRLRDRGVGDAGPIAGERGVVHHRQVVRGQAVEDGQRGAAQPRGLVGGTRRLLDQRERGEERGMAILGEVASQSAQRLGVFPRAVVEPFAMAQAQRVDVALLAR